MPERSALLPVETNEERPRPRRAVSAIAAIPNAAALRGEGDPPGRRRVRARTSRSAPRARCRARRGSSGRRAACRRARQACEQLGLQPRAALRRPPPNPAERTTSARTPAAPHSRATSGTRGRGDGDDGEVDRSGHVGDVAVGRDPADRRRPCGCTTCSAPVKPPAEQVVQHRGADDARLGATRRSARPTVGAARARRRPSAAIRSRSSKAATASGVERRRELELQQSRSDADLDRKARVAEDVRHPVVRRMHRGDEAARCRRAARRLGEVREQDRRDAAPVALLGDLERDLGARRAHPDVRGVADDPLRRRRPWRRPRSRGRRPGSPPSCAIVSRSTPAEKNRSQRDSAESRSSSARSSGWSASRDGADAHRGAVAQRDVHDRVRERRAVIAARPRRSAPPGPRAGARLSRGSTSTGQLRLRRTRRRETPPSSTLRSGP